MFQKKYIFPSFYSTFYIIFVSASPVHDLIKFSANLKCDFFFQMDPGAGFVWLFN